MKAGGISLFGETIPNEDRMLTSITLSMENYMTSCPTGCVVSFSDGDVESEYCETVSEFIEFLSQYKEMIKRDDPFVYANIDVDDMDATNVLEIVKNVRKMIEEF